MTENELITCDTCKAVCCRYIATPLDTPVDKEDFQHLRWFLMHENIWIHIDDEDDWYVEFRTPCKNIGKNNECIIHNDNPNGKRLKYGMPDICTRHPLDSCEMNGEGEAYEHTFKTLEEFERYVETHMPEIITREVEIKEDEEEECKCHSWKNYEKKQ